MGAAVPGFFYPFWGGLPVIYEIVPHFSGAVRQVLYPCKTSKIFVEPLAFESMLCYTQLVSAGVMELVDVVDSKSTAGDSVPVRVRSPAPRRSKLHIACSDFFKSQSALIALLLLSKSNPLRWASIWFWAQSRKKIDFAALVHVGAKSAPLRFKAVPFGDRLKTALRSFAPPFQLEPAALGFELVLSTVLMAGASEVAASFLSTQDVVENRLFMPVVLYNMP